VFLKWQKFKTINSIVKKKEKRGDYYRNICCEN